MSVDHVAVLTKDRPLAVLPIIVDYYMGSAIWPIKKQGSHEQGLFIPVGSCLVVEVLLLTPLLPPGVSLRCSTCCQAADALRPKTMQEAVAGADRLLPLLPPAAAAINDGLPSAADGSS